MRASWLDDHLFTRMVGFLPRRPQIRPDAPEQQVPNRCGPAAGAWALPDSDTLVAIVCVFLAAILPAHAATPKTDASPLQCVDTESVDSHRIPDDTLPMHTRIATYLATSSGATTFSCQSSRFAYEGRRDANGITVTSRYLNSTREHAKVVFVDEYNIGGFRKHGAFRTAWPDDKLHAIEFYCWGFEVGFHRYYDRDGTLRAVIDYSKSDYQIERNRKGGHEFIQLPNSRLNASFELHQQAEMFREIYVVDGAKFKRVRFQTRALLLGRWVERDPNSTVKQWTSPGMQGPVALRGSWERADGRPDPWILYNEPFDYTSFSDLYQRDRSKVSTLRPPTRLNTEILRCPWIDQAMAFASEDKRFALTPVKLVVDSERQVLPENLFGVCIQRPTANCLLSFALGQAKLPGPHRPTYLRGVAVAAIVTKHPRFAIEAVAVAPGFDRNASSPNPIWAPEAALRAEAEALIGNATEAQRWLDTAFTAATTKRTGYPGRNAEAIMLTGPILAGMGRYEQVRTAYRMAVEQRAPRAHEILAELGIAYALAGRIDDALHVAEELRRPVEAAANAVENRPGGEQLAEAVRALTGVPYAQNSRQQAYLLALVGLAQGLATAGESTAARNVLSEIEAGLRKESVRSSTVALIAAESAAAYGRLGDAKRAAELLGEPSRGAIHGWVTAGTNLCAAGRVSGGREFLARAHSIVVQDHAGQMAQLGAAYAHCGMKEKAREVLRLARDAADKTPFCSGDMCYDFTSQAQDEVAGRIIDAGELNLLEGWPAVKQYTVSNQIRAALRQAQLGDRAQAMSKLTRIAEIYPETASGPLRVEIVQARGEVLAMSGEAVSADLAFDDALRTAKAIPSNQHGARALVRLAQVQIRTQRCKGAGETLRHARLTIDRTRMSNAPGIYHDEANALAAVLANEFARCGYVSDAHDAAHSTLVEPNNLAGKNDVSALLANRILAQVAIARGRKVDPLKAFDELAKIAPSVHTLTAALELEAMRDVKTPGAGKGSATEFLLRQAGRSADYFLSAQGDLERRILIGNFAHIVRAAHRTEPKVVAELFSELRTETTRIGDDNWRARALCELGYTARAIGREDSESLFGEGLKLAKQHRSHTFPLDPPPSGACAYWLRLSGNESAAQIAADLPIEPLRAAYARSLGLGKLPDTGTLIGAAIAQFEVQSGEIQINWSARVQ